MLPGPVPRAPAPSVAPAVPVVDVFAGPGGLGEGFAALRDPAGRPRFALALSIERDAWAHRTLSLRALVRRLGADHADARRHLRGDLSTDALFDRHPAAADDARAEAWHCELGAAAPGRRAVRKRVDAALRGRGEWALVGGPPCQAYSVVGRSRNRGVDGYRFEADHRATLYVEYLQLLADHRPAVFVMENVRGLLSARHDGANVFDRIAADLRDPSKALAREGRAADGRGGGVRYDLHPLTAVGAGEGGGDLFPDEGPAYVVRAERHGVPQARHRVIVVGVRRGFADRRPRPLDAAGPMTVADAIDDLPRLRGGLSRGVDTPEGWAAAVAGLALRGWHQRIADHCGRAVADAVADAADAVAASGVKRPRGGDRMAPRRGRRPRRLADWYGTDAAGCVRHHAARGHMASDLRRYLFAAAYARVEGRSPALRHFPAPLLPAHVNAAAGTDGKPPFADRFRVQVAGRPATTVASHISRDGRCGVARLAA